MVDELVDELIQFWRGVYLEENGVDALYRLALICVSSDLPANRKCCGFMSYNALKGCSKCLQTFHRDQNNKPDYSGYDVKPDRNSRDHREHVEEIQKAKTAKEKATLEYSHGARYSELLRLPYFDPITGHIVDVMHNMLLGSAKHIFTVWIKEGLLDDNKIKAIDAAIKEMTVPSEIGRVAKSMLHYKTMKAAEWKNWVTTFSLYSLKNVLSKRHYNLWQLFVRASNLYIKSSITADEARLGHELLLLYCKKFETIYGINYCTPNMHMHMHIKSCILEFGPTYGFWCFSFERYNGILGSFSTNNHALTITLMRKFVNGLRIEASYQRLNVENLPTFEEFNLTDSETLGATTIMLDYARRNLLAVPFDSLSKLSHFVTVPKLARLLEVEINQIKNVLISLVGNDENVELSRYYHTYNKLRLGRELISSYRNHSSSKDSNVIVNFVGDDMIVHDRPALLIKLAQIEFCIIAQSGQSIKKTLPFAQVSYLKNHAEKNWFGHNCPMKLYDTSVDLVQFVPVHYIVRKCSITKSPQKFNCLELANGKRSIHKAIDVVNFVI